MPSEKLISDLSLQIPHFGISLLDSLKSPAPAEALYIHLKDIELMMSETTIRVKQFANIGDLQIDSSSMESLSPVVISRSNKIDPLADGNGMDLVKVARVYGARFSAEIYTRGCHWIPRMFA
jgi:hypothetical protein